jgi:tRNA 2-thiouridine synthesizing protein E
MLDINQTIAAAGRNQTDSPGNLAELEPWSESRAAELAAKEGVTLTPEHWAVIRYLRNYYAECGPAAGGNTLLHCLGDAFADRGGKKHLYMLFPGGPVSQGSRIAGLPVPPYSNDPSFGTVE